MLRLLLREERHEIRNEYFARLAIVCSLIAISLMLIWALLLLSLYVQVRADKMIASGELAALQDSDLVQDKNEARRLSGLIKDKIGYLNADIFEPTDFIYLITENQNVGITLNRFEITFRDKLNDSKRKVGEMAAIELSGIADTRADLVEFQNTLNNLEVFDDVEAPYSSFASNENLPFNISIQTVDLTKQ